MPRSHAQIVPVTLLGPAALSSADNQHALAFARMIEDYFPKPPSAAVAVAANSSRQQRPAYSASSATTAAAADVHRSSSELVSVDAEVEQDPPPLPPSIQADPLTNAKPVFNDVFFSFLFFVNIVAICVAAATKGREELLGYTEHEVPDYPYTDEAESSLLPSEDESETATTKESPNSNNSMSPYLPNSAASALTSTFILIIVISIFNSVALLKLSLRLGGRHVRTFYSSSMLLLLAAGLYFL